MNLCNHRRLLKDSTDEKNASDDFDANMVIILAALLCALICALGLNFILRCASCCRIRLTHHWFTCNTATGVSHEQPPTTGNELQAETPVEQADECVIKKYALNEIPIVIYNDGSGAETPSTECAICIADFKDGDMIRVLPNCKHGFHISCIDTWLISHSSCPCCRYSLLLQCPP